MGIGIQRGGELVDRYPDNQSKKAEPIIVVNTRLDRLVVS